MAKATADVTRQALEAAVADILARRDYANLFAARTALYEHINANPTKLPAGTRIEVTETHDGATVWVPATIGRWRKVNGPRMPGYHVVQGHGVLYHETMFRVVDNRGAA